LRLTSPSVIVLFRKFSDIEIIEGIQKQDDKVLNWLYSNYYSLVRDHVVKNSGSDEDVADILQDSIIIIFEQINENKLHLTSDLKGYFFGIVKNVWNVQLRKKQRTTELISDTMDENELEESNNLLLEKIMVRAFEKLKPDQQLVLKLFSEGLTFSEIALRMDLKSEEYARRKKYLSKEALLDIVKEDPEYHEYLRFLK
jgi:RNA polymerase sigma factor (sigma-70 family)